MSDASVHQLHREVQRAVDELNARILKLEGEKLALVQAIKMTVQMFATPHPALLDVWNQTTEAARREILHTLEESNRDWRDRQLFEAAAEAFRDLCISDDNPVGFRPIIIPGGKTD